MMIGLAHRLAPIKQWWRLLIIFLTPIILLPIPLVIPIIQARCGYIVLLLTVYWVSEAMPYSVTSLLPLAFFPLAGILTGERVGSNYFKDISTLFIGSMTLAQAMEHVRLHRRVALLVLSIVGSSIKWSMAGIMAVTAFLSMWINNSAATSIMIPAAVAIIDEMQLHQREVLKRTGILNGETRRKSKDILPLESTVIFDVKNEYKEQMISLPSAEEATATKPSAPSVELKMQETPMMIPTSLANNQVDYERLKTGFLIAVAYSAAVGGLATLVGTGPNIFVKGFTDDSYKEGPHAFEISFTNFLLFAFPIGLMMIVVTWLWLQFLYNRQDLLPWIKKDSLQIESQQHMKSVLKEQYKELGGIDWKEGTVAILFVVMVLLWITRDLPNSPGWEIIFREKHVTDGTVALLIGSLPLILPDRKPWTDKWEYHPILTWDQLSKKFPWGVFMLQGAGLAIADAFRLSDLSSTIADLLQFLVGASDVTIIVVVILISAIFTEFTSNLACASILFPILNSIAKSAEIHAARLILPSCMAVSLSFMLPIATPPNAMIFASGNVKIRDLIKAGIGMKIFGCLIILFASTTFLTPVFRINPLVPIMNSTLLFNTTSSIQLTE